MHSHIPLARKQSQKRHGRAAASNPENSSIGKQSSTEVIEASI